MAAALDTAFDDGLDPGLDDGFDAGEVRRASLPSGALLVVRAVTVADADGLAAFYDHLDVEDRYRRFLSAFHPDRRFVEKLCSIATRGGVGLVAVVDDGSTRQIVAEASYTPREDGDGELGITVAREWRGWLGPYVLDALLEVAAERGVPRLQADVLATNHPMLTMARARGATSVPDDDWTVVRLLIDTAPSTHRTGRST